MTPIPTDPETRLRRKEAAEALTAKGYPISAPTLASMVTQRRGPPFYVFNNVALYRWADLLAWAESRSVYRGGQHQHQDAA